MTQLTENDYETQFNGMLSNTKMYLNNNGDCGTGKTTSTIEFIEFDIMRNPDHHWIIAVPLHKIVDGEGNILDMCQQNNINAAHIWGKNHFEHFDVHQCYFKGCKSCPHKLSCDYLSQRFHAQVIVIAYETLDSLKYKIGTMVHNHWEVEGWYGLVIEEEPSRYWFSEMEVTNLMPFISLKSKDLTPIHYWGGIYNMYQSVEFTMEDKYQPINMAELQLKNMIKSYEGFKVHESNGRYTLIGHKYSIKPSWVNKVIFNCATTPADFRDKIFNITSASTWKTIGIHKEFSNPCISIGSGWGIQALTEEENKTNIHDFVNFLSSMGKKILVVTKQKLVKEIENADVVYYGSSRGFNNNSKDYDLVIVYGAFHWNPLSRVKYTQMGIMESTISDLENAEVIQAVNRFRPILRPNIPVILMTQHIEGYGTEIWTQVPKKSLGHYCKNPVATTEEIVKDEDMDDYNHYGYVNIVEWLQRYIFKVLDRNRMIIQCRMERISIKKTAARCRCSVSTVKKVMKKVITKYGDKLPRFQRRLFELEV